MASNDHQSEMITYSISQFNRDVNRLLPDLLQMQAEIRRYQQGTIEYNDLAGRIRRSKEIINATISYLIRLGIQSYRPLDLNADYLTEQEYRNRIFNLEVPIASAASSALQSIEMPIDDNKDVSIEMLRCPVCQINVKDIRLTCGHLVCGTCAIKISQLNNACPICREPIRNMDKVYYKKYLKYKNKYVMLRNKISQH